MRAPDMSGVRFGALLVVARGANNRDGTATWECVCDCGERRVIAGTTLRAGRRRSCGCQSPRFTAERMRKHGLSRSRTYSIWHGMRQRCESDKAAKKHLYCSKGIRVCERWQSFENFVSDMGLAPDGCSIERLDGNADYRPANCVWATPKDQANNTTRNRRIEWRGRTLTISQWAESINISPNTLLYRIRRGWPTERAMTEPNRRRATAGTASASCGT